MKDMSLQIGERVPLVRVDGDRITLEKLIKEYKGIIPTSDKCSAGRYTQLIEKELGLPPSVYFYFGRACDEYGNYAIALRVEAVKDLLQSWTPFDTGAMYKFFNAQNNVEGARRCLKNELQRDTSYRQRFAKFLTECFNGPRDYWRDDWEKKKERPTCPGPEGLYHLDPPKDKHPKWTLWIWEIRIEQEVDLKGIVIAWSFDKHKYSNPIERTEDL
jgi:hypothetical protein